MKRLLMLLSIITLMTTTCTSQTMSQDTVVPISQTQLKAANLIFAEHEKLKGELPLLESKIANLETINSNWEKVDSLRLTQVELYKHNSEQLEKTLKKAEKINRIQRWICGGSIIATVILTIICAVK